jgi:hypothetical protein
MKIERLMRADPTFPRFFKFGRLRKYRLAEIEAYERRAILRDSTPEAA